MSLHPNSAPAIAEIFGPSGIGKTTLYLESMSEWNASWAGRGDLKGLSPDLPDERVSSPLHEQLLFLKARNLEARQASTLQKFKLMRYFSEVAFIDLALSTSISRRPYFLDEGLFHNFGREIQSIGAEVTQLVANRILFFLSVRDPRIVIERIHQRRRQSGHLMTAHSGKSDEELVVAINEDLARFEQLVGLIESVGGAVHRIFAEDGIASNRSAVCNGLKLPPAMI